MQFLPELDLSCISCISYHSATWDKTTYGFKNGQKNLKNQIIYNIAAQKSLEEYGRIAFG